MVRARRWILLFVAGMNNLPTSVVEAAQIDGAGFWRLLGRVIIPLMRPILFYQVVVSVIGTVQIFTQFFLLQGPGSVRKTSRSTRTCRVSNRSTSATGRPCPCSYSYCCW